MQKISNRYDTTVDSIMELNNIEDPDFIRAGRLLWIPAKGVYTPAEAGKYVVRRGDTLSKIAKRFHTSIQAIAKRNGIENPNRIAVGQVLDISTDQHAPGTQGDGLYTVARNDTLSKIAKRYDTTVQRLLELNPMEDPNWIIVGQQLRVNAGSK